MELLGKPYKIVYESKNLVGGLTGIFATIIKPDGNAIGPFPLTEIAQAGFSGVYTATLNLTTSDLEGTYTGLVISPNEGNYSRAFKATFIHPDSVGGGGAIGGGSGPSGRNLIGKIKIKKLVGSIENTKTCGILKKSKLSGSMTKNNKLKGVAKPNKLSGVLKCKI